MRNPHILTTSDALPARPCTLTEELRAIEVAPHGTHSMRLGPVSNIPAGALIDFCGEGFNEDTVKIRWRGKSYFIFLQDLQDRCKPAVRIASCSG
jgi:hypothetical protein